LLPLGISNFPLPNGYWASLKIPLRLASFTTHLRGFHIEIYGGDGLALTSAGTCQGVTASPQKPQRTGTLPPGEPFYVLFNVLR
ncbi:hypothetical protein, partial [Bacteroides thetaiotaomicron]|uniref:hypothetical protein n=1 Tax=Bacteroides thetaiotaomicron TaxID=818 RepID=UPI00286E28EF